jgi:hypothetical protein
MVERADGREPSSDDRLNVEPWPGVLLDQAVLLCSTNGGIDCGYQECRLFVDELGVRRMVIGVRLLEDGIDMVSFDDGPGTCVAGLRSGRATSLAVGKPLKELRVEDV